MLSLSQWSLSAGTENGAKTQPQDITSFSSGSTQSLSEELLHTTRPSPDFLLTCYPGLVEDQLHVQKEKWLSSQRGVCSL